MFFCRSDDQSCQKLLQILQKYEVASGQTINKEKSAITFSSKTAEGAKGRTQSILRIQRIGGLGKYLGLPEYFTRKKKDLFNEIIDRIIQRSLSWSSRFLSTAGKGIMLKSVLVAMPTYTMSCFKLPGSLCKRIQSALTRFWWDGAAEKRKMSWIAWSKLTEAKRFGGLGFRDIPNFNDALLAKVSWRILTKPSCLLARVLCGKYCKDASFLDCPVKSSASHGWRGICIGRDLLKSQLGKAIGTGVNTNIWYDPWLSLSEPSTPMGPPTELTQYMTVKDLLSSGNPSWDGEKIRQILPNYEKEILELRPSRRGAQDRYIWLLSKTGEYSAKSGYQAATEMSKEPQQQNINPSTFNWTRSI